MLLVQKLMGHIKGANIDEPTEIIDILKGIGASGRLVKTFASGRSVFGNGMAYSPDGRYIASAVDLEGSQSGDLGIVEIWDVQSGQLVKTIAPPRRTNADVVAFSPDGRYLVYGSGERGCPGCGRPYVATGERILRFSGIFYSISGV